MKTVGIIGGSGFIGSHTTKKFLQEGFKVRVSATDISKPEKYNHLKSLPNAENFRDVIFRGPSIRCQEYSGHHRFRR